MDYMVEISLLTKSGNRVLNKKLSNIKLTQVESNYLSKTIRPKLKKLKEVKEIEVDSILQRIEYNQKGLAIEEKLKNLIKENLGKELDSIIVYGSVIQTNYQDYNDVDIILATKNKIYKTLKEKWGKVKVLKDILKKNGINGDIQILSKDALEYNSSRNPNLIYQLKDYKLIYGKLEIPKKIEIYNADLHMKLDASSIYDPKPKGDEIYRALRNCVLVRLLLNKIVDNKKLKESLYDELGKNLIERLKNNKESKLDRKIALSYLKELVDKTRKEIGSNLWEKIEL